MLDVPIQDEKMVAFPHCSIKLPISFHNHNLSENDTAYSKQNSYSCLQNDYLSHPLCKTSIIKNVIFFTLWSKEFQFLWFMCSV